MNQYFKKIAIVILLTAIANTAFAIPNLGSLASGLTDVFGSLARLVQAVAFVIGCGFLMGALIKYKAHRDNPEHVTLSIPVTLFILGVLFIILGIVLMTVGQSVFGPDAMMPDIGTTQINTI